MKRDDGVKKAGIICAIVATVLVLTAGVVGVQVYSAQSADFPDSLTVENKTDGVYIDWSAHLDADGYYVHRWDNGKKETIATVKKLNKTAFTDTSAKNGKVYQYSVCTFDDEEEPVQTNSVKIMRLETPEILSVENGVKGIDINWKKINDADKYTVYRDYKGKTTSLAVISSENPCSFTDTTALSGCKYKYSVVASTQGYKSDAEYEKSKIYVPAPDDVKAVNNNGSVSVSWSEVSKADNYLLYRKTNNSKWTYLGTFGKDVTDYTDYNVSNGNVYTYTVKALSKKIYSGYDSFGISTNYVSAPSIKSIANVNDCVKITWNKTPKASQYRVYKMGQGETRWTFVGESRSTTFTDTKVGDGIQYTYTVRAVGDKGGLSTYTGGQSIMILKKPKVKLYCMTKNIMVKWSKMPLATSYRVYRKVNNAENWTYLATVNADSDCYVDTRVKKSVGYTYTVRQVSSGIYGSYDSGVSVKFNPAPTVNVKLSPKGLLLNWNKSNAGSGYYIDRKTEKNQAWKQVGYIDGTGKITYTDSKAEYGCINSYRIRVRDTNRISNSVSIYGIDPKIPAVALTYDDGPHPTVTHDILDVLEKYDSRATFFVVGSRVSWNEDSVKRASKLNCEIANHTYNHKILTSASNDEIASEISKTNNIVKQITGKSPVLMRAPGGSFNSRVKSEVGMPLIQWSVDTLDWKSRNASSVISVVKNNACDGSIILMHDLYGSTAEATETIVPWLISEGYQLVTVSELMQLKGIDMKSGNVYFSGN